MQKNVNALTFRKNGNCEMMETSIPPCTIKNKNIQANKIMKNSDVI